MKKKLNLSTNMIILIAALVIFGGYLCYAKVISDSTPPVVVCDSDEIVVSVKASDKTLMKGVTAVDKRSGDVTDSLVIESISTFADDERIIVYAAIDEHGNVGRAHRTLKYKDYEPPTFELNGALRFSMGSQVQLLDKIAAKSTLDGDLSGNVKYTSSSYINTTSEGEYEVEYRVTDSTGTVSYLPVEVEIYNPLEEQIAVELSDYLIYLEKGSYFDPGQYYVGASADGVLSISSDVDTDEEGIYMVEYTVSGDYSIGKSRLVVVVTGQ